MIKVSCNKLSTQNPHRGYDGFFFLLFLCLFPQMQPVCCQTDKCVFNTYFPVCSVFLNKVFWWIWFVHLQCAKFSPPPLPPYRTGSHCIWGLLSCLGGSFRDSPQLHTDGIQRILPYQWLVCWDAWASAVTHTMYLIIFPLISILYNSNGCHVSFFSAASPRWLWWIAFLGKWQHSCLNVSDLVCFAFHTCAPKDSVLPLIYVCTGKKKKKNQMCLFSESLLQNHVDFLPGNWSCIVSHAHRGLD